MRFSFLAVSARATHVLTSTHNLVNQ
jgi:hypothetical protein